MLLLTSHTNVSACYRRRTQKDWVKAHPWTSAFVAVTVLAAITVAVVIPVVIVQGSKTPAPARSPFDLAPVVPGQTPRLLLNYLNDTLNALDLIPPALQQYVNNVIIGSSNLQVS